VLILQLNGAAMSKRIAIVDDEVDICRYLSTVLEDEGYSASVICHTEPVVDRLLAEKPDLVILDIMMPGISGLSIYKQLQGNPAFASVKIAILSGMLKDASAQNELAELTGDPGFMPPDAFIPTPVDVKEFLRTVATLLSQGERP
jgi:CheY-like chemotaxis protein